MVPEYIQDIPFELHKSLIPNQEVDFKNLIVKKPKSKVDLEEREIALWRLNKGLDLNFKQLKLLHNLSDTALRKCVEEYFMAMGKRRSGKMISVNGKDFQKFYDENCVN